MPESTSSDLNAVANSAGPDENIHKEQSGCCCCFAFNGLLRQYFSRYGKREIMGDDSRINPHPHLLQAQCAL